ncbi:SusC/RagA family TonB-linked outer membrane protein [Chitinophaga filiformis]|uniref:TonB-linked outer membrane protein, SusC/RagA family n=1 Tax=Chitinophaga filiformis TaxID=104663 RepID=A0A1G7NPV4_CHIFI|nr:SusC/RagA family TonB-linked outer membrane protein [Chitinophaga filiformis]SDF75957.1 TonB-linked outer membrane protein, SusC/RagA family [Chitinophaga filiformis]
MKLLIHVNGLPLPDPYGKRRKRQTLLKYVLVMKLFIAILIISLNVSASGYSQKVSLSVTNASLQEVMKQIRKQTGHYFMFTSDILRDAKPVSVRVENVELEEALEAVFKGQPFSYVVQDGAILVKSKAVHSLSEKVVEAIESITIRGKVVDQDGRPLAGASVKAGEKVTITNDKGEFELADVDAGTTVQVSYVGYRALSVKAGSTFMTIGLESSTSDLNEVVINKGYYTTTKELNTGNVSIIQAKDLEKNPVSDPLIALEGQVPGLYISQSSGVAGAQVNVKLRGQNSLRLDANNPLYIVNGVPYPHISFTGETVLGGAAGDLSPFAYLSLNDIDRIEVLKDADATAIYGSRGANGVILITTKKGQQGRGKVTIDVNSGVGKVSNKIDLMKTPQYIAMRRQALLNDGISAPTETDYDLNGKWGDLNQYTDWQRVLIGNTANITTGRLNISGGNVGTQFIFGGTYRRESTVFPGEYRDQKASGYLNVNHESDNKKFHTNISISYLNDNNQLPAADFTNGINLSPNTPKLYNSDGSLNWQNSTWENPLWVTSRKSTTVADNLNSAAILGYEILDGLSINARLGYIDIKSNSSTITPFSNYNPDVVVRPSQRRNSFGGTRVKTWIIEPSLNYVRVFGKGKLEALIGGTLQQNDQNSLFQSASGFSSPALVNNILAATTIRTLAYTETRYRYNAVYARIGYDYQGQYLINLTGRRDASSRFGPGKQFADLGAIGVGWIFSKQRLFADRIPFISFGKVRASYGITGNDQISDYRFLSTYSSNGFAYQGTAAVIPTSLTNPDYSWETVKKLELGLESGFVNNRILLNISWYQNRTSNQLVEYGLPNVTGFNSVQANLPAVIQNRGTEFDLNTNNIQARDFSWTTSVNLSIPRNKLLSYPNLKNSSYSQSYVLGQPLSLSFMYHYTGVDPITNIYSFEDVDKDGQITYESDRSPVFIGQRYFGGVNNSFSYKRLQLEFFVQFVKQVGHALLTGSAPGILSDQPNQLNSVLQNEKVSAGYQKFTQSYDTDAALAYTLYTQSDATIVDASFIRLKNVSLSWNLPERYKNLLKMQSAKIYLQGQNLFTITSYKGLDPEVASSSSFVLPPLRILIAGIQLTF